MGIYRGHEGLLQGWRRWRGVWERYDVEIEELLESGDRVLGLTRSARAPDSEEVSP